MWIDGTVLIFLPSFIFMKSWVFPANRSPIIAIMLFGFFFDFFSLRAAAMSIKTTITIRTGERRLEVAYY